MTTRLAGAKTRFLPFNRGRDGGAGNPANQAGHRMAYLWRDVWAQDNWLDLLQRFVTAEQPAKGPKTAVEMIFPRSTCGTRCGRLRPPHDRRDLYTMRQAIEEGFILDVLASYTIYKTYWNIQKRTPDDPAYDTAKAKAAIARFVSLHEHNLAQKGGQELRIDPGPGAGRRKPGPGTGRTTRATGSRPSPLVSCSDHERSPARHDGHPAFVGQHTHRSRCGALGHAVLLSQADR